MTTLSISDYSKTGTEAAFSVLSKIAAILADCTKGPEGYCVIGGWVPFLLCRQHASLGQHVGSLDVDILLDPDRVRLKRPEALGLELLKANFDPEPGVLFPNRKNPSSAKWWARNVAPKMDIRIDFMAPTNERSRSLSETFAANLKILRFYGTNAATHDPLFLKPDNDPTRPGAEALKVPIPIANAGATLMSKSIAYEERRHDTNRGKGSKDAYDLFYLLTSYRDGGDRLIEELLANPEAALRAEILRTLESDFTSPQGMGTQLVCDFLADPPGGRSEFAKQVSTQVSAFLQLVKDRIATQ